MGLACGGGVGGTLVQGRVGGEGVHLLSLQSMQGRMMMWGVRVLEVHHGWKWLLSSQVVIGVRGLRILKGMRLAEIAIRRDGRMPATQGLVHLKAIIRSHWRSRRHGTRNGGE